MAPRITPDTKRLKTKVLVIASSHCFMLLSKNNKYFDLFNEYINFGLWENFINVFISIKRFGK